jgi:chitinase
MIRSILCIAVVSLASAFPLLCAAASHKPQVPVVVAYVFPRNTLLQPGQIDAHSITRINYAFANIEGGRIVTGNATDAENFAYLTALRKENPSLTVLVSVGGWLGSGSFSDISQTDQSRKFFVESAIDFLERYNLDGIDVDWEYPGMAGAGHAFRSEDQQNFTLLLKELRERIDQQARTSGRRLYLTIAAGASSMYLAHTEMEKVQRYVDTVNVMAYDYSDATVDPIASHNAPLYTNPAAPKSESADASVLAFERAGVPSTKIVLGVPFYGHLWGEVADTNHGLFQPGKPVANGFAPYGVITDTMLNHGFIRYWDSAASAPYLYNAEQKIFVSYEDPESLAAKCGYILTHKLGGIMFWEYLDDPSGVLLKTIDDSLHRPAASQR